MSTAVRALRGATTVDVDKREHILERVTRLLTEIIDRNGLDHDDLIRILFTATDDIHSAFPATAARQLGLGDVPLICARELDIEGGTPRCIRVLIHLTTDRPASSCTTCTWRAPDRLRDDLPD